MRIPVTFAEQVGSVRRSLRRALAQRLAEKTNRPYVHLLALRVIARGEVRTQAELAERLAVDAPSTSRLVTRLERDGLLLRCEGSDRRCVHLQVTDAARPEIAAFEAALRWLDRRILATVTAEERDRARAVLAKIEAGLGAY